MSHQVVVRGNMIAPRNKSLLKNNVISSIPRKSRFFDEINYSKSDFLKSPFLENVDSPSHFLEHDDFSKTSHYELLILFLLTLLNKFIASVSICLPTSFTTFIFSVNMISFLFWTFTNVICFPSTIVISPQK